VDAGENAGTPISRPAAGVSQHDGQTAIDFGRFFGGTQTSLYVSVKKER
jgi:hypothetical protein